MKWVYLLIAILTEVVATGALKASHSFTRRCWCYRGNESF